MPRKINYKAKLWKVFSQYIRQRDRGVCITCGKVDDWKKQQAGHYVARSAGLSLYFDERNVNAQCPACNLFKHGNLTNYALALMNKYGDNILNELDRERRKTKKISPKQYQELIEKYKKLLEDVDNQ